MFPPWNSGSPASGSIHRLPAVLAAHEPGTVAVVRFESQRLRVIVVEFARVDKVRGEKSSGLDSAWNLPSSGFDITSHHAQVKQPALLVRLGQPESRATIWLS